MRNIKFLCLCALLLLCSCAKKYTIGDYPFSIEVSKLESRSAWVDILPDYNDFYYYEDVVKVSEFEKFASEEAFIQAKDKEIKDVYKKAGVPISFRAYMLSKGLETHSTATLESETEYYAYAIAYNDDNSPSSHVTKVKFKTLEYIPSDLTFSLSLFGSKLTCKPSNDRDSYFGEYDFVENIDGVYKSLDEFFEICYNYYRQYDLLDIMTVTGEFSTDLAEYFKLKKEQELYAVVAGCNKGRNTSIFKFKLTYMGEDQQGKVEMMVGN